LKLKRTVGSINLANTPPCGGLQNLGVEGFPKSAGAECPITTAQPRPFLLDFGSLVFRIFRKVGIVSIRVRPCDVRFTPESGHPHADAATLFYFPPMTIAQ
jgi:hypothetical protein